MGSQKAIKNDKRLLNNCGIWWDNAWIKVYSKFCDKILSNDNFDTWEMNYPFRKIREDEPWTMIRWKDAMISDENNC